MWGALGGERTAGRERAERCKGRGALQKRTLIVAQHRRWGDALIRLAVSRFAAACARTVEEWEIALSFF
jgi:hypothetical protein